MHPIALALALTLPLQPPPPAAAAPLALAAQERQAERPAGGWLAGPAPVRLCDAADAACLAGAAACEGACFEIAGETLIAAAPGGASQYQLRERAARSHQPIFVAVVDATARPERGAGGAGDPCGPSGLTAVRLAEFEAPAPLLTADDGGVSLGFDEVWVTLSCGDGAKRTFLRQVVAAEGRD